MKNVSLFASIFLICFMAQCILPWWVIAPICGFLCFYLKPTLFQGIIITFFAVSLLWASKAYFADQDFDVPLSRLLGQMFGGISSIAMYSITALIGGIVATLGAILGIWGRRLWFHNSK